MNPDPEGQSLLSKIALILTLTLLNAYFASAELAFVSINRSKLEKLAKDVDKK